MRILSNLAAGAAIAIAAPANAPANAQTNSPSFGGFVGLETMSFLNSGHGPESIHAITGEFRLKGQFVDDLSYDLRLYGRQTIQESGGGYFDPTVAKLTWQSGAWQVDVGYDLLFWGVAEGRNVVNIVNQRDQIRDLLGDQGLGQAMLAGRYFGSSYTVEGFILPGFRELDFGASGRRWGFGLPVDDSDSTFESGKKRRHIDYAFRLSGIAGDLEYGLSVFDGTLRQPRFNFDPSTGSLTPHYALGRQVGLELQYTAGPTLLKLEAARVIPRKDSEDSYWAGVAGIEYLTGSALDLPWETTLYAEYNWDSRGDDGPSIFQNDVFLGLRVGFGNVDETELRLGMVKDLEHDGMLGSAKLTTRLNEQFRLVAEYIFTEANNPSDALFNARDLDQVSVSMQWHF